MSVLLVGYDLDAPGQDYKPLWAALRRYTHHHALDSTWFLDTTKSASDVRDELKKLVDKNDQVFAFKLRKNWAAARTDEGTAWLKDAARSWD
jgi:CRISPR/Cas system-associated endoribonuclease Cas2